MTKYIAIASGKGGVGKTTTSINLALALTNFGRNVILVDGNIHTPHIGIHLGSPLVPCSFHDVLAGDKKITEAIYLHPSGLRLIPGSIKLIEGINYEDIKKHIHSLNGHAEVVIIDCPPGFTDSLPILESSDETLLVVAPEISSVTDAIKTKVKAEELHSTVIGAIIVGSRKKDYEMSKESISSLLETPILSSIPFDEAVKKAQHLHHPVVYHAPFSASSTAYKELAGLLIGQGYDTNLKYKPS